MPPVPIPPEIEAFLVKPNPAVVATLAVLLVHDVRTLERRPAT